VNLRLTRTDFREDGIFGELETEDGDYLADTLEHAYPGYGPASFFVPKVAIGTYECIRHAPNRLPYETFLLVGVPTFMGHPVSGILIHRGNTDADTEGCILLGRIAKGERQWLVADSRATFARFMKLQENVDRFFILIV
jgi:hypothetical protein